jgi:hypothetical protein
MKGTSRSEIFPIRRAFGNHARELCYDERRFHLLKESQP